MTFLIGLTFDLKPANQPTSKLANELNDFLAEFDTDETISYIKETLKGCGHDVLEIGSAKDLIEILPELKCDIIFNIAEGMDGRNRESQVPAVLDVVNVPYVGSDALTLAISLDKVVTKKIFAYHKIPTPRHFECRDERHRNIVIPKGMHFPFIVKPRYEGSAKGITPHSKVINYNGLRKQVRQIIRAYKQPALVEEFISGREFTVGIIGNENPLILPVAQRHLEINTNLSSHIFEKCGYDTNRLRYQKLFDVDADLKLKIKRLALKAFYAIECRDFARIDFRVDEKGVYALEINPLPSLARDDYFALSCESLGMSYGEMINMILKAAVRRYRCLQKTYTHIQNIVR